MSETEVTPPGSCSHTGCGRELKARGLCWTHYSSARQRGLFETPPCRVPGCDVRSTARALCQFHYGRDRRGAALDAPRRRARGQGSLTADGYVRFQVSDGSEYEHRRVMEAAIGRPLRNFETVHHINGVRDDNRRENLELWAKPQPAGQRVADLIVWLIAEYGDELRARIAEEAA